VFLVVLYDVGHVVIAKVTYEKGIWYLCTSYGVFSFNDENTPTRLAEIINASYERGLHDKINEIRAVLNIEDYNELV
jgi:hypothetical protein